MAQQTETAVSCRPHIQATEACLDLAALAEVIAARRQPAIIGGNPAVRGISIFAAEPVEVLEFHLHESAPFEQLLRFLNQYQLNNNHPAPEGFCGGWIGCLGYELGRFIETLPGRAADDLGLPVIRLGFYDKAIIYDPRHDRFSLVAVEMDGDSSAEAKFATLHAWLDEAKERSTPLPPSPSMEAFDPSAMNSTITQADYFAALKRTHRHIIDGDVYQINFSQRFSTPYRKDPLALFNWQNRYNPSPFAAYLAWDKTAIVSASPELFLEVRRQRISTCPIKGTRPRNAALPDDAPANRAQFAALFESEKEQAELAMIIDLERNDLARICLPGTRHVACARRIEAFPTVYHAVATVEGMLAMPPTPERVEAILRATFPGGSITGAPKIRAMEIIDALEPTARGVYTGGIGWIGLNYDVCLNIAIRTVIVHNNTAHLQVGGGIVADSDPQAEWEETLNKAQALAAGTQAINRMSGGAEWQPDKNT
ncbi:MAG: anthranilate synthase component I family protein [Phycisphaerae bacterium]|nr:anthranilate synthase component I family protein [Phycisphaerae bacterium]